MTIYDNGRREVGGALTKEVWMTREKGNKKGAQWSQALEDGIPYGIPSG
jgi:hypothetical protein